jgi:hypothetical protein
MGLQDTLQEIYREHGRLTAHIVLDEARDPAHPLHGRFTWDDSVAAERYRLSQARELIRTVKVVYKPATARSAEKSMRAYHSVPDGEGRSFRPVKEVAEDPFMLKVVLSEMERDWKLLRERYSHLAQFAAMVQRDLGSEAA